MKSKKKKKKEDCGTLQQQPIISSFVITHFTVVFFSIFIFTKKKYFFPSEIEIKKIFSFSIVETHCLLITTMCCTNDGYTYLSTYTYLIG